MFKKYIRNIVKEQIDDIRLENTLKQSRSKNYWEDHFKAQVKHTELLVKRSDEKISKLKETIEDLGGKLTLKDNLLSEQKQENEKLKQENKQLKNLSCTIVVGNDGKLDSLFNQKLKSENEKLQRKLREIKKEIDSQGFDNEGFYNLQNMYIRIEKILNES